MKGIVNWIDIFIGLSCVIPFAMGIAGRGILRLSLSFSVMALSLGAAYLFSGELVSGGLLQSGWSAGGAVFAVSFALLSATLWALKKLPGARGTLRIADGFASALFGTAVAVLAIGAAQQWSDGVRTEDSVFYSKAAKLYGQGAESAKEKYGKRSEEFF